MALNYTPIGEVLNGLELKELPSGMMCTEAVVLIKALDVEGEITWLLRYTQGVPAVEVIGAITVMQRHKIEEFENGWLPDEDDD